MDKRIYDETRYLTYFGSEKYDANYNKIRCLISQKSGIIVNNLETRII